MAIVNLSCDDLDPAQCDMAELLAQVQALEKAGLTVRLNLRNLKGNQWLEQLAAVNRRKARAWQLPVLLTVGYLGTLAALLTGWYGF